MNYYNDFDKYCCEWLNNLIAAGELPPGDVDDRSITDVQPDELRKYDQCHFFCGIGGWPLALRLAGADDVAGIWTGSCPCQPYSSAGKGLGDADPRNLWPQFFRLIRECRPERIIGEQVEAAIKHGWLDGISADLEAEDYTVGSVVLGAHSVGAPHIRQRLYWVADAAAFGRSRGCENGSRQQASMPGSRVEPDHCRLADMHGGGFGEREERDGEPERLGLAASRGDDAGGCGGVGGMGDTEPIRLEGWNDRRKTTEIPWSRCITIQCRDGKLRRISSQSGDEPLASRIPTKLGQELAGVAGMAKLARRNRVGRLRGYGNAICVETAVEFIKAYFEGEQ